MTTAPPTCIVNAVGPAWFGETTQDMQLGREIPAASSLLERCYVEKRVTFIHRGRGHRLARTSAC